MITSGTYFVFPSESNLEIDSTDGLVKIVLPTAEAISTYISGSGGQVPEVIAYTIVGAATNPVRFYRGGGLLWNNGAEYLEITADGSGTISRSSGIESISESVLNSAPSYKVYVAILNQTGTDAPTTTVLKNTLGVPIIFQYDIPGYYFAPLIGQENKVVVFIGNCSASQGFGRVFSGDFAYNACCVSSYNSSIVASDDLIVNVPIEIRVYP